MSADIVPFAKKTLQKIVKTIRAAEDGVELDLPTPDDLNGFLNTLNFLAQQSACRSVSVELMGDDLNMKILHHDHDEFSDAGGVISATTYEIMAGVQFIPEDYKKTIEYLLIAFERLEFENYETDVIVELAADEDNGTPTE